MRFTFLFAIALQTPVDSAVDVSLGCSRPLRRRQDRRALEARVVSERESQPCTGTCHGVPAQRLARAEILAEQVGAQLVAGDGVEHA